MIEPTPRFEAYGTGGDYVEARRARRAFRYSVLTCLCFTFALYFSENYLLFSLVETQYIMSVTLDEPSARAILHNVVRRDQTLNDRPTPRYLSALAQIEESDAILERYEQAYQLEPNNAYLIINYGCYLFHEGQFREARERFREAGILPPENALPRYLEAAALAASLADEEDLSEIVTIIVRTNNSAHPLIFPEPPWHHSLPKYGYWYMKRQREIADQTLAPLYRLKTRLVSRAHEQILNEQVQDWSSWLGSLDEMANRFIGNIESDKSTLGIALAQYGLSLKTDVLTLREALQQVVPPVQKEDFSDQHTKLASVQKLIYSFEDERDNKIAEHREQVVLPLYLIFHAFLAFSAAYFMVRIGTKLMHIPSNNWTISHVPIGRNVLLIGLALLTLVLLSSIQLKHVEAYSILPILLETSWYSLMTFLLLFGVIYPAMMLPKPAKVVAHAPVCDARDALMTEARKARKIAYFSFMRCYYGILLGGLFVVVSAWVLLHRMIESLYPTQIRLLTTGLYEQELELIQQIQRLLGI